MASLTRSSPAFPPGIRPWPALRALGTDGRIFGAAVAVISLHLLVDAATHPGGGGRGALETLVGVALVPALVWSYGRASRPVRTLLAGGVGLGATAAGISLFAVPVAFGAADASDLTGLLLTLAGLALLGLGFRLALAGRRRRVQALAILPALVVLQWAVIPAVNAGVATTTSPAAVPDARTLGYAGARDVEFEARDGVRLSGWYVPGRNGAAVLLLHGSHGDRSDTLGHLRLLVRAGYTVLAYDARGHGESGGATNALGWAGTADAGGALDFVARQAGVDPDRIGALGLSMGAEQALRAAADGLPLRAVVADGAGASTLGDLQLLPRGIGAPVFASTTWLSMRAIGLISRIPEPAPLREISARIRAPVLLVASHAADERGIDRAYRARIGSRATLWYVADAGHTEAVNVHPGEYAARVSAFFRTNLATR